MKNEKDCKIVQDLLPNYIDKLTTPETNEFIEEHLKTCVSCSKQLENMKNDLNIATSQANAKEVKFLKKYNLKLSIFRNLLLIILIIFVVIIARRMIIFNSLAGKANATINQNNYHSHSQANYDGKVVILDSYCKDGKLLQTLTIFNLDTISTNYENMKITCYNASNEQLTLHEIHYNNGDINLTYNTLENPIKSKLVGGFKSNFIENLIRSFQTGIQKVKINGVDCYKYNEYGCEKYVNTKTGLFVRVTDNDAEFTSELYDYEFNTVTDEDVAKPSIEGYTLDTNPTLPF